MKNEQGTIDREVKDVSNDTTTDTINTVSDETNSINDELIVLQDIRTELQLQNEVLEQQAPVIYDTSRMFLAYGFIYVPLFFVCMCLWWFFKQFINKY